MLMTNGCAGLALGTSVRRVGFRHGFPDGAAVSAPDGHAGCEGASGADTDTASNLTRVTTVWSTPRYSSWALTVPPLNVPTWPTSKSLRPEANHFTWCPSGVWKITRVLTPPL